ncbi:hypothetical protein KOI35_43345 [Actinoplanes bogorensis]|uniref:Uncharacterized protein n=1 Tax=Paractinoplanes bogorensis TaxID=1610840 RepID=A0ABS5Z3T7_9ACTN|nr:hypothetical protein [Actinoplanes bogorensis]MBU2670359.1 hypothetical protein [Actinoplanes bogorensis]
MTSNSLPADADPRQLLADTRGLARQVRHDQRLTWVALLVLAGLTLVAIPIDWFTMKVDCLPPISLPKGQMMECTFDRRAYLWFWPPALLLAYAAIAYFYLRAARARGIGARVRPYVVTGAVLTGLFLAAGIAIRVYLATHDAPEGPLPGWFLLLDRTLAPWGIMGLALLVLARIERNVALLAFTVGYLIVALVPVNFGWAYHSPDPRLEFLPQQVINGIVLLLGSIGFFLAGRRRAASAPLDEQPVR